jgi:ketosteroid isomerase-like protein
VADRLIEISERLYDAFDRDDAETVLAHLDPDLVVLDPDRTGRTYRGYEGFRELVDEWLESWDEYSIEVTELTRSGERVLADLVQSGVGKGSGIEFNEPLFQVLTFAADKVVRFEIYNERADAERAAALAD